MAQSGNSGSTAATWLAQDDWLQESVYTAYRSQLAQQLETARRRERLAYWVCAVAGVLSFTLMFVGGSRVLGSFDPWDKSATVLSMALGGLYVASSILFWGLLASYYSRFRPHTRLAQEQLRDAQQLRLEAQVAALQQDIAALKDLLQGSTDRRV